MKRIDFSEQIKRNKLKSFMLLFVIFGFFVLLGWVISLAFDRSYFFIIMAFSILFSLSYILISYYNSDKIAISSVGAKKASRESYKDYHRIVEALSIASGLPMPRLYVMNSSQINAFASGRNPQNAVICVTKGALEKLTRRELEGVLAHEMSHIANYDIRYLTLVSVVVGMVSIASQFFLRSLWFRQSGNDNDRMRALFLLIGVVLAILAPIAVQFIRLAISRKREYSADASAVKFTRNPRGLIGALKKIKLDIAHPEKKFSKALEPMFFSNPFKNFSSTHPPLDKRIEILERM